MDSTRGARGRMPHGHDAVPAGRGYRRVARRGSFLGITFALLLVLAGTAAADSGIIGPSLGITGNGRHLQPAGALVGPLGNFPTGGAVTPNGRFYWTVSTGRGFNDIRIISLATKQVVQIVPIPGASGGIAMNPKANVAYVSGVADSRHLDQQRPNLPGGQGDVVHAFSYDPTTGHAKFKRLFSVPPPSDAPPAQTFPPGSTKLSWPDRLAVSPNGGKLLVPLNLADRAAIVDVASGAVSYVSTGTYPYGAAITPDGKTGLVSNEGTGTVSIIDLASATKVADVDVGHLTHPEAIVVGPQGGRAFVAIANSDRVAVIGLGSRTVVRYLSTRRFAGDGTSPSALALTPNGGRLLVAESGADELTEFNTNTGSRVGRIPTAAYPTDVRVTPDGKTLLWTSGKGLGIGPNPNGGNPFVMNDDNANSFQYPPLYTFGDAGVLDFPSDSTVANTYTPIADAQVRPSNGQTPPAGTPLAPGGPIKHVFFIVKENRTYDQVLGDDGRGDGDPSLTLFGRDNTPNLHALVRRFPLLDHVYADSEASIQGHFWTSAAKVSDYVEKNWFQNYGARGRPFDFGVYAITFPQDDFLFDQANRDGVSWFNYGEALAGDVPLFPDKDRTPEIQAQENQKLSMSDLGPNGCYANDSSVGKDSITGQTVFDSSLPAGAPTNSESRYDCFNQRFTNQLATNSVPALNYMVLMSDHTRGLEAGSYTPRAMVADNDLALGQIVDRISHSSIWSSSAIFVVEDDSQDGADHVDAHRTEAAVISPYAPKGLVVHTRYDQLSIIRSIELILGMHPLGLFDALATPMYDAFTGTAGNSAAYDVLAEKEDLLATNPNTATNRQLSAGLDLTHIDSVPQRTLDAILWKSVHGVDSTPPPPGPNADPEPEADR
jgi:DNA-binding beta-propeller fold protein YncE